MRAMEDAKRSVLQAELGRFRAAASDAAAAETLAQEQARRHQADEAAALRSEAARLREVGEAAARELREVSAAVADERARARRAERASNAAAAEVARLDAALRGKDEELRGVQQALESEQRESARRLAGLEASLAEQQEASAEALAGLAEAEAASVDGSAAVALELQKARAECAAAQAGSEAAEAEAGRQGELAAQVGEENARLRAQLASAEERLAEITHLGAAIDEKLVLMERVEADLAAAKADAQLARQAEQLASGRVEALQSALVEAQESNEALAARCAALAGPLKVTVDYAEPTGEAGVDGLSRHLVARGQAAGGTAAALEDSIMVDLREAGSPARSAEPALSPSRERSGVRGPSPQPAQDSPTALQGGMFRGALDGQPVWLVVDQAGLRVCSEPRSGDRGSAATVLLPFDSLASWSEVGPDAIELVMLDGGVVRVQTEQAVSSSAPAACLLAAPDLSLDRVRCLQGEVFVAMRRSAEAVR